MRKSNPFHGYFFLVEVLAAKQVMVEAFVAVGQPFWTNGF